MRDQRLPIPLTSCETSWGLRYLLFQMVFLGPLLDLVLRRIFPDYSTVHLNFAYFSINFCAVLWIFRSYLRASMRLLRQQLPKVLTAAAVGFVAYWVLNIATGYLVAWLQPEHFNVNDSSIAAATDRSFWLMAIGTVVLAPVAEELFYRALVFGTLHRRSRLLSYAVSVAIFSVIHISGYVGLYPWTLLASCFLQYLPGGLVLAWGYEYSGSILTPIALHMAINAIGVLSSVR